MLPWGLLMSSMYGSQMRALKLMKLYKRIEKGEVIGVIFYYTREISGVDAISQAALVERADFEKMITTTKGCRFVGNKVYGLPMGDEVFSLEGAHLSSSKVC